MELLANLAAGFEVALTQRNLAHALVGTLLGTLIGVLPRLGPAATIAMLLPLVHVLDTTAALIMLAGVYYGARYGSATAAILVDVPGGASSQTTAVDGHQMARQGRAGPALAATGLGSFFAGCVGALVIAVLASPLNELASRFGPAESFSLMVLGLTCAVVLASGALIKAIAMVVLGLLLGRVNGDVISAVARSSFGIPELTDEVGFVAIAIGVFGFGAVIMNLGRPRERREAFIEGIKGLWPAREDFRHAWPAVLRGTGLGSLLGVLPGGGALLSSIASYTVEKRLAGAGGRFGRGDIRGVAGPGSAGNAGAQTSFLPMLTLGIPANAVMALMIGAMIAKGIPPGSPVVASQPQVFWGLVASICIGNLMLLILSLALVGVWIRLATVPYRVIFPAIVAVCAIGLYTINDSPSGVYTGMLFGLIGYVFFKLHCQPAPLILGFVLGPMMEENLRRALLLSRGDWGTFVTRPLSAALLAAAALMIVVVMLPVIGKKRRETLEVEL